MNGMNGSNGTNGYATGGTGIPPVAAMGQTHSNGVAAAAPQDSRIVRFSTNVPEIVAIKFRDGKEVEGRFGAQWMYSLADGRQMYVAPIVAERIGQLEIQPGELFSVCKREVKEPGMRKPEIRWQVERLAPEPPAAVQLPQAPANGYPAQSGPVVQSPRAVAPPPTKIPMNVAVVQAVRMVQQAMKETGEQWSDGSRQDLVATILITYQREGWLTIAKEAA